MDGGDLDAIKTVLSIMERRAKFFGFNATVALHLSEEMTDIEFAEKWPACSTHSDPTISATSRGGGRRATGASGRVVEHRMTDTEIRCSTANPAIGRWHPSTPTRSPTCFAQRCPREPQQRSADTAPPRGWMKLPAAQEFTVTRG